MTEHKSLLKDLDKLLVKVAKEKKASIKQASPGDDVEDGTSKPVTGEQLAKNKEEAGKHTAAKVDGGAKANPVGGSLEASTDGATAVAASGQKGGEGADLSVKGEAPNGPEGGIKSASVKELADALRKVAAQVTAVDKTASAKESEVSGDTKQATAQSSLDYFLVQCARSLPQVKSAAEGGMDDSGMADHATQQLLQALQSGEIGEEDAEKMLMEMAQKGAISEQDLMEAMQAMHQDAGGQGAPAGADAGAGAGAPPMGGAPDAGAAMGAGAGALPAGAPPMGGAPDAGMVNDPALEAKVAALHIDAKHPDYIPKLASLYSADLDAGYELFYKVADQLVGADDDMAGTHAGPADMGAPAPDAGSADAGAGAPPAGPDAGMTDPNAVLSPTDPAEQQALMKLLADMGLTPDDLKNLMAQKAHGADAGAGAPPAAPMDAPKLAAFREKALTAILRKTAEQHLAALAASQK